MPNIEPIINQWTEFSAYTLGFWMADGSISIDKKGNSYYKTWETYSCDKDIMQKMSRILNCKFYTKTPSKSHHKTLYSIKILSDELFDYCYNIVGSTKKSHSTFNIPHINDKNINHFIRGIFDGDGSIFYVTYKNRHGKDTKELRTSITAGLDTNHLEQIQQILMSKLNTKEKKLQRKIHKKLCYGQYESMLLCDFMYSNCSIFMNRKKNIWDKSDKTKLNNSKIFHHQH